MRTDMIPADDDVESRDPAIQAAFEKLTKDVASAPKGSDGDLARMQAVRDCAETLEPTGHLDAIDELRGMGYIAGIADETMSSIVDQGLERAVHARSRANGRDEGVHRAEASHPRH
jgi:hypothetical protein